MTEWQDDIEKYKRGELTSSERHALEKKALHDPFLADALEGLDLVSAHQFSADLKEFQTKIKQPIKDTSWIWPLRIAASLVIILGAYWLTIQFIKQEKPEALAMQREEIKKGQSQPLKAEKKSIDSIGKKDELIAFTQPKTKNKISNEITSASKPISVAPSGSGIAASPVLVEETQNALLDKAEEKEVANEEIADLKKVIPENKLEKIATQEPTVTMSRKEAAGLAQPKERAKRSASIQAIQFVKGQVISAEDGSPLLGVNVVFAGTTQGTVTDSYGNYQLQSEGANPNLVFSFIGFQTKQVAATNQQKVNVKLEEEVAQLSEVVVTAMGVRDDLERVPIIKLAEPAGGRKAYDKYLEKSLQFPAEALALKIKGKVAIKFIVRTDGSLDEFNIIKSLGHGCDQEVLRLVKEGPAWYPTTEDNVPVESKVLVRVKFDPAKANK